MRIKAIFFLMGIILIGIGLVFGIFTVVSASTGIEPISKFEVDIYGPPAAIVSIQVPDDVDLGNLSYDSYSDDVKVEINNTGNVAVNVRPALVSSDEIYSNLYFRKRTSGNESTFTKIGDWSMNITAPTGNVKEDWFYVRLDLREYGGDIESDLLDKEADVKFIATQLQ